MSTLESTYTPSEPPRYRVTRIDTEQDLHYLGRRYDNHYDLDDTFWEWGSEDPQSPDHMTKVHHPVRGAYLVEELHPSGVATGRHELLTPEKFQTRYRPL